jgi:hypothetical protein
MEDVMEKELFSKDDLYKKLGPCLNLKIKDLRRDGIEDVSKKDIWDYLKKFKWKKEEPFLSDMVNDILNTDNIVFKDYVDGIIKEKENKKDK